MPGKVLRHNIEEYENRIRTECSGGGRLSGKTNAGNA